MDGILKRRCAPTRGSSGNELENELTNQQALNIDETGHPHNKTLAWLLVFATNTFAFFTIRASRGSRVIRSVPGELFDGIIISDRFSAYIKYHKDRTCGLLQLCRAHIIRDVKALSSEPAHTSQEPFSRLMRQRIGTVFSLWHAHKHSSLSRERLVAMAQPLLLEMRTFLEQNLNAPSLAVSRFCGQLLKNLSS
ncbi:MAG TPA: transposase [Candidatus Brocadiaceae bacterium]|nr:transposase [Candidatus Brocadiaceae bacterium]